MKIKNPPSEKEKKNIFLDFFVFFDRKKKKISNFFGEPTPSEKKKKIFSNYSVILKQ